MPKSSPVQYAFNGGLLGTRMQGRSDLARYQTGCNVLRNFIPSYQGPAIKRSGFRHVKPVKDSTKKTRLIPFEFSREQAYVLELGEGYMRVMRNSGAVLETAVSISGSPAAANPVVVTTSSSHGYSNGDEVFITGSGMSSINDRYFTVANVTATTMQLSGEDGSAYSTGTGGTVARTYEIADGVASDSLPWLEAELFAVNYVQSADVLYLVHENHPPHKISRTGETAWTAREVDFQWPPFRPENSEDDVYLQCAQNTGSSKELRLRSFGVQRRTTSGSADWVPKLTCTSSNATPVVITTASAHGYSNGDTVWLWDLSGAAGTALNDNHYTISNVTGTTFTLDGTTAPGAAGTNGGVEKITNSFRFTSDMVGSFFKMRELPQNHMPAWVTAGVWNTRWSLYDTSPDWAGRVVHHEGVVYSTFKTTASMGEDPPFGEVPGDEIPNEGGALSGGFSFYNRGEGYGKVTAVDSDGLTCTIDIVRDLPYSVSDANPNQAASGSPEGWRGHGTQRWSEGAFSEERGYPRAVAFYEDRLWFAGTKSDPQTFWGSRTGEYEDFEEIADQDDSSVTFTLASDKINAIEWMSGESVLLLGTLGGEFTVDAGNAEQAITPSNIRVRRRSNYGSAENVRPAFVDSALLFVQRSKTRLHELIYDFSTDGYIAPDLTQMSHEALSPGVVEMAYQAAPLRLLWCVISDGSLSSLTYIRDEDVLAWAEHTLGGADAKAESVAAIPHPDGDEDQVWVITSRTVGSSTVRHIEYLEKPFAEDGVKADAFFVDDGLTYSGAATTTITGLHHLEGESVKVLADGFVVDDATVSGGAITIGTAASKVQVGLGMPEARVQTMRVDAGGGDGTAMGKRKRAFRLVIRVNDLGDGLKYGTKFGSSMGEYSMRDTADAMDTVVPLFTGDTPSLVMPNGWEAEGRIAVAHDLPLPCTVVSLFPQMQTEAV